MPPLMSHDPRPYRRPSRTSGRHGAGKDIVAQGVDRLALPSESGSAKQLLEIVSHPMFKELRAGKTATHRIDAGNRDEIGERSNYVEWHAN